MFSGLPKLKLPASSKDSFTPAAQVVVPPPGEPPQRQSRRPSRHTPKGGSEAERQHGQGHRVRSSEVLPVVEESVQEVDVKHTATEGDLPRMQVVPPPAQSRMGRQRHRTMCSLGEGAEQPPAPHQPASPPAGAKLAPGRDSSNRHRSVEARPSSSGHRSGQGLSTQRFNSCPVKITEDVCSEISNASSGKHSLLQRFWKTKSKFKTTDCSTYDSINPSSEERRNTHSLDLPRDDGNDDDEFSDFGTSVSPRTDSGKAEDTLTHRVDEFRQVAKGMNWHIVLCMQDQLCTVASGSPRSASKPQSVPPSTEAVVLWVDPYATAQAGKFISEVRTENESVVPVIPVLVDTEDLAKDTTWALQVQELLLDAGADDVILWPGNAGATQLAIKMSLVQIRRRQATYADLEAQMNESYTGQLHDKLKKVVKENRIRNGISLFWQTVHRTMPGFPSLDDLLPPDPQQGDIVGPCTLAKPLGRGQFGEVYLATNMKTGEAEAIKMLLKSEIETMGAVSDVVKEISSLAVLQHPNIIQFHGALQGPCHVFLRMEMAGRRSLFKALRNAEGGYFATKVARHFQAQLSHALLYCHAQGIAHRDLKPENIGVSDCGTKLRVFDWGSAMGTDRRCTDMVGTIPFAAPEVYTARQEAYLPAPCDVWSAGVILLEMLCGVGKLNKMMGWERNVEPHERLSQELHGFFSVPGALLEAISEELQDPSPSLNELLAGMLQVSAENRWTTKQVDESEWLQKTGGP